MNVTSYRHDLHALAEGGYREYKTKYYIKSQLKPLCSEVIELGRTGIAAYFDFGRDKTFAFRTELDALPITENTGNEFTCRGKFMHACGHDGHMAILLSLAELLSDGLLSKVNVLLIFQPAEEKCGGALSLISSGIFDRIKPEAIFGLHIRPGLEKGAVFSKPGVICAGSSEIDILFSGEYAGVDFRGEDAMLSAAKLLILCKDEAEKEKLCVSFGKMQAGAVRNAVAGSAGIFGTARYFSRSERDNIKRMLARLAGSSDLRCVINFRDYAPPLENDAELFRFTAEKYPVKRVDTPLLSADDFSQYKRVVPRILYLLLGAGETPPLHSDRFDFDENILFAGVDFYRALLL